MAFANSYQAQPLGEMNTTPLIDVLLVLLVMFVITIPAATHTIEVDLPGRPPIEPLKTIPDQTKNKIVLTSAGQLLWNGAPVTIQETRLLLAETAAMTPEPELQFEPEATASYDLSAKLLNTIKASGVTKFGFVGNERYREFGRAQ